MIWRKLIVYFLVAACVCVYAFELRRMIDRQEFFDLDLKLAGVERRLLL